MLRPILTFFLLIALAIITSAATNTPAKRQPAPDVAFFFANNDSLLEATATYAEMLCLNDKAKDDTPAAWLAAGRICADSYRDDRGEESSNDGAWQDYRKQAFDAIGLLCATNATNQDLCSLYHQGQTK